MKGYFLKDGGREVKLGQIVEISTPVNTSYGEGTAYVNVELTEETLPELISDGFILVKEEKPKPKVQIIRLGNSSLIAKFSSEEDAFERLLL